MTLKKKRWEKNPATNEPIDLNENSLAFPYVIVEPPNSSGLTTFNLSLGGTRTSRNVVFVSLETLDILEYLRNERVTNKCSLFLYLSNGWPE